MSLEKILSVSGKSGLYRLIGQMKNGIIVESLEDGKRFPVHGSSKVSALEEISIYTSDKEVPLSDVFKAIYEKQKGKSGPDHKGDQKSVIDFFKTVLPDYDKERVYVSDMIKVVKWYNIMVEKGDYDPTKEEKAEEKSAEAGAEGAEKPKKTSKKTTAKPKSASAPKANTKTKSGGAVNAPRKAGGTQRGS